MKRFAGLLLSGVFSYSAFAVEDSNRAIDRIGVQGNYAYFTVTEGLTLNCEWSAVYLDITTDFGRAAYSNLLAAKTAGKKLSRVVYSQAVVGERCHLSLVEIKD